MANPPVSGDTPGSALAMLADEHDALRDLFHQFERLAGIDDDAARQALVDDICQAVTVHDLLEDDIFYPALRAALDDAELLDEADVEHASARELVSQLEAMAPGDDHFDATVIVLGEELLHHIDKEEGELFDLARAAGIDLDGLGERLAARRDALDDDFDTASAEPERMVHNGARRAPRPPD